MALESEIKLGLPPRSAARLAAHPLLAGLVPQRQRLLNTYYDTPDLRLQRARVAVRYRRKGWDWLLTVKCAAPSIGGLAQRNEWEYPGLPGQFDFAPVDDSALRTLLDDARTQLVPLFTTDFTRTAWLLVTPAGARIELALDRGHIVAADRREAICELELELLAGPLDALFATARTLQAELPLHPEAPSKAERGYRLFAGTPLRPVRAAASPLERGMAPVTAFRAVALACLTQLQGNEAGVRDGSGPEFVHQGRVALRRLRSALRVWKPLLPAGFIAGFDPRWRALAQALGGARNWDVLLDETLPPLCMAFPGHPALHELRRRAGRRQRQGCRLACAALGRGGDYARLLLDFTAALHALPENETLSLDALARRALHRRAAQAWRLAEAASSDGENRHRLRIALKRLRYALEFFAPLCRSRRLRPYQAALTRLLDTLGLLNDLWIAGQLTAETLPDSQRGALVQGWLAGRHQLLLQSLPDQLATLQALPVPWKHR